MSVKEVPVMKAWTIRIKSGPNAGRWVGGHFGGGLVTNPEVQNNPPVNVTGSTKYGLWAQQAAATRFFEGGLKEAIDELTKLGYDPTSLDILKVQG